MSKISTFSTSLVKNKYINYILNEDDICIICFEKFEIDNPRVFITNCKCKNFFHVQCLLNNLEHNDTCPSCRNDTNENFICGIKQSMMEYMEYEVENIKKGINFYDNKIYKKARKIFEEAVKLENSDAIIMLGQLYHDGKGVKKDYNEAIKLYERAREFRHPTAMNNLGYMYNYGQGVEQDYDKAKELYEKATKLGNTSAMINLGHMYNYGRGVEKDCNKAKELYEKAIYLGNEKAIQHYIKLIDLNKIIKDYVKFKKNGK